MVKILPGITVPQLLSAWTKDRLFIILFSYYKYFYTAYLHCNAVR